MAYPKCSTCGKTERRPDAFIDDPCTCSFEDKFVDEEEAEE